MAEIPIHLTVRKDGTDGKWKISVKCNHQESEVTATEGSARAFLQTLADDSCFPVLLFPPEEGPRNW